MVSEAAEIPTVFKLIRQVWANGKSGQKHVTIPRKSDIQANDYVYIIPVREVEIKDGKIVIDFRRQGQA